MIMNRRSFLKASAMAAMAPTLNQASTIAHMPKGKAEHCIFIWLGGGMSQIDTFDPKKRGSSKTRVAGSDYASIDTSVSGVKVTEHLSNTAKLAEDYTIVRTVNHRVVDEHAFATNIVHTGRMISGTITYPSIGSIVAHQRGAADPNVPAYMLIGYPNVSRSSGFLGPKHNFVYLVDTESGPAGFSRPEGLTENRVARRENLLKKLTHNLSDSSNIAEYEETQREALRLAGPDFMRTFNLKEESDALRNEYGSEFGQRCLLARRLVESGVRFIEVSHNLNFVNGTGWDTHNDGQQKQHLLIQDLDVSLAALLRDLKKKGLLDKTLVALGTEFGRPAGFDSGGGRGHQGTAFSLLLAGGGLNHQGAYGVTDEMSKEILENPVSVPDFHATIHAAMGINPSIELTEASRPVPITDGGKPIQALFS